MRGANALAEVKEAIRTLFPGYFALVMATGIVSVAASSFGYRSLAEGLWYLNLAAYAVLVTLLALRLILFPRSVLGDLKDHGKGPGFFTAVAATCLLGSQSLVVGGAAGAAKALWWLGIALWWIVMYAFFTATVVREEKPPLETGINGAWLLAIVATQSVSVLGALLGPTFGEQAPVALFFSLCMYLLGSMLYLTIITLIFYRFTFVRITTGSMTPPYWINMGAVAITTLAGSTLLFQAPQWAFLEQLRPFLTGFTLFFWASATWWIPLLVLLGVWRHGLKRFPLRYDPQYWGMVFPLGMYTVCTLRLAKATGLDFLVGIPRVTVWIALLAWSAVSAGLVWSLVASPRVPATK